ncbi:MAG: hypothetical protein IPN63_07550 [Gammaproteobacteria bacterium]|nr:hypothetical protein [Gammaproteobacteria bacterium]
MVAARQSLIQRAMHRYCAGRPCRVIDSGGGPYMVRVYVGHWGGYRAYLHRYDSADGERWLHDHPFSGLSIILSGGYVEEVLSHLGAEPRRFWRRWINWIPARKLHRISRVLPGTWTLFVHGPHRHKWGFLEPVETEDGSLSYLYFNPFDQSDSAGAHWWARPGVAAYPPEVE